MEDHLLSERDRLILGLGILFPPTMPSAVPANHRFSLVWGSHSRAYRPPQDRTYRALDILITARISSTTIHSELRVTFCCRVCISFIRAGVGAVPDRWISLARTPSRAAVGRCRAPPATTARIAARPPSARTSPGPEVTHACWNPAETRPYRTRPDRIVSPAATARPAWRRSCDWSGGANGPPSGPLCATTGCKK